MCPDIIPVWSLPPVWAPLPTAHLDHWNVPEVMQGHVLSSEVNEKHNEHIILNVMNLIFKIS